jgi:hypothetical protein
MVLSFCIHSRAPVLWLRMNGSVPPLPHVSLLCMRPCIF